MILAADGKTMTFIKYLFSSCNQFNHCNQSWHPQFSAIDTIHSFLFMGLQLPSILKFILQLNMSNISLEMRVVLKCPQTRIQTFQMSPHLCIHNHHNHHNHHNYKSSSFPPTAILVHNAHCHVGQIR